MIIKLRKTNPKPSAKGLTAKEFYDKIKRRRYGPIFSIARPKKENDEEKRKPR